MDKIGIEISKVLNITAKSVQVVVTRTGKPLWLSLEYAELYGSYVYIPLKLYFKIFGTHDNIPRRDLTARERAVHCDANIPAGEEVP